MASPVNKAIAPQVASPDSSQRIATKTLLGIFSGLGGALALGGARVAAVWSKEMDPINIAYGVAAALVGASLGGVFGKLIAAHKVSLNDVKDQLGVQGSDLNFSQMHRIANIGVAGGVFLGRSTVSEFKDDVSRIKNLNRELTNTEFSLSSGAHNTSKARGVEDRFFDFEGAKLANQSQQTSQFIEALQSLKAAIHEEVKATDKYTYQIGNASTSVSRREYILAGIMGFAYERGIASSYLTAAVKERAETANSNPKLAEANFRKAVQKGIEAGILVPNADTALYAGMVDAGVVASQASKGRNPDSIISSLFNSFKDASLINDNLHARFVKDVHQKMSNPDALIVNPTGMSEQHKPSIIERLFGIAQGESNPVHVQQDGIEEGFTDPRTETKQEAKRRLAEEAQQRADEDVNQYADGLALLDPSLKELGDLYEKLIGLLNEKKVPLDQIMDMGPRRLRGVLALRHKEGFDLFDKYEANDGAIQATREQIAALSQRIDDDKASRPGNFRLASKQQRNAAEVLEKQIKAENARISELSKKAAGIDSKIDTAEATLVENEDRANTFLFPATEAPLPEPELPKQPGFFERFFSKSNKTEEVQVEDQLEGPIRVEEEPAVAIEEVLDDPNVDQPGAPVIEDPLPEPVIVTAKPRWKFWA